MIKSRIDARGRTKVPREIREALGLRAGDEIVYRIEADQVMFSASRVPAEHPFATFQEWGRAADQAAYGDL